MGQYRALDEGTSQWAYNPCFRIQPGHMLIFLLS